MATTSLDEKQFKVLPKQTLIGLFGECRDLFSAMVTETLEDIGLANAFREERKNDFMSREELRSILAGQKMKVLFEKSFMSTGRYKVHKFCSYRSSQTRESFKFYGKSGPTPT